MNKNINLLLYVTIVYKYKKLNIIKFYINQFMSFLLPYKVHMLHVIFIFVIL